MSFAEALARGASRGKGVQAYWYTEHINRPAARMAAAALATLNVSANTVTMLSFAFTLAGLAMAVYAGSSMAGVLGAYFLLVVGYVLDSADGQVARILNTSSPAGEWLDHILDNVKHVLFHGALLLSVLISQPDRAVTVIALAVIATAAHTTAFTAHMLFEQLQHRHNLAGGERSRDRRFGRIAFFVYDWGILIMLVLVLPFRDLFFAAYGLITAYLVLACVAKSLRMFAVLRGTQIACDSVQGP